MSRYTEIMTSPIAVHATYAKATKSVSAAILLVMLIHHQQKNGGSTKLSNPQIAKETFLSDHEIHYARKVLKEIGVLEYKDGLYINLKKLNEIIDTYIEYGITPKKSVFGMSVSDQHKQDAIECMNIYNQNRGHLPEALDITISRISQIADMIQNYGRDKFLDMLAMATRFAATEELWVDKHYNLDNLLPRVIEKAEKYKHVKNISDGLDSYRNLGESK